MTAWNSPALVEVAHENFKVEREVMQKVLGTLIRLQDSYNLTLDYNPDIGRLCRSLAYEEVREKLRQRAPRTERIKDRDPWRITCCQARSDVEQESYGGQDVVLRTFVITFPTSSERPNLFALPHSSKEGEIPD